MASKYAIRPSQKMKQDDSVMGTNNSSIVSKRSVERLYHQEPHFFRYFVKKPQRRSPLINRGYWLRMYAVERVLMQFLREPSKKRKLILNLGCGYDPSPFQLLSRSSDLCQNVTFIDVDYPALIAKKAEAVNATPQLRDLLTMTKPSSEGTGIYLQSEQYYAVGCDLTNVKLLNDLLKNDIEISQCKVICTAEVSITYMDTQAADNLIRWAASYSDMSFCLLEQFLPDGADHPFAKKMLEHFKKLQTPLRSISTYPELSDQRHRFLNSGWSSVTAQDLWSLWNDPFFLSLEQSAALDTVEPFDEWEEFILFASHYFLLVATTESGSSSQFLQEKTNIRAKKRNPDGLQFLTTHTSTISSPPLYRRFGALFKPGPNVIGLQGGLDSRGRTEDTELFSFSESTAPDIETNKIPMPVTGIHSALTSQREARMCHTMTSLGDTMCLLVGGRASPDRPLKDCWKFEEGWRRVGDLPIPLYRHCAAPVTLERSGKIIPSVLVFGGKSLGGQLSEKWFLWCESVGWSEIPVFGGLALGSFGATMAATSSRQGIMLGGIAAEGKILRTTWCWTLICDEASTHLELSICTPKTAAEDEAPLFSGHSEQIPSCETETVLYRFGAELVQSTTGLFLIGGVSNQLLVQDDEIIHLSLDKDMRSEWHILIKRQVQWASDGKRPLLVGHSSFVLGNAIVIAGGGAVCFSFGTHWNMDVITVSTEPRGRKLSIRRLVETKSGESQRSHRPNLKSAVDHTHELPTIERLHIPSNSHFEQILQRGRPVVMSGLDFGACTQRWTFDELKGRIGVDREVVVHQAVEQQMNFQQKNFAYVKKPFGTFIDEIVDGSRQYLRSLAADEPSNKPANIALDYPEIATDFELPPQLDLVKKNRHSSILRISGPVNMWLHYDVMANVLCQVRGTKRLLLFPPSDISQLSIPPGASSSFVNCFDPAFWNNRSPPSTQPLLALLEPGDILFIPPLWLHTACPAEDISIAVNVFFRNLESGYAAGKDVYGNRDVQAYEKGRKDIDKIARSFDHLPREMGRFYLERLAHELQEKALQRTSLDPC